MDTTITNVDTIPNNRVWYTTSIVVVVVVIIVIRTIIWCLLLLASLCYKGFTG